MQLLRVQIPEFRALKNIDIQFRKELTPKIFPVGSENGGGKSTLLQLIFILLHCSCDPQKQVFIRNLLADFKIAQPDGTLAKFEIWDGQATFQVEFLCCNGASFAKLVDLQKIDLSQLPTVSPCDNKICYEREMEDVQAMITDLKSERNSITQNMQNYNRYSTEHSQLEKQAETLDQKLESAHKKTAELQTVHAEIIQQLEAKNFIKIATYENSNDDLEIILCRVSQLNLADAKAFLKKLCQKIFLAIPYTQICLFLSRKAKKSLFKSVSGREGYYQELGSIQAKLPQFFMYEYPLANTLLNLVDKAVDQDFPVAIKTKGQQYGTHYAQLLEELENVLVGKEIAPNPDRTEITFMHKGTNTRLFPEDFSHGELRRLSIYAWLRYNSIQDGIVLFDEIEIALHPDWQFQIGRDLQEWGPNNQYVLATHSYPLCENVTPAHVNDLEPKLFKQGVKHEA